MTLIFRRSGVGQGGGGHVHQGVKPEKFDPLAVETGNPGCVAPKTLAACDWLRCVREMCSFGAGISVERSIDPARRPKKRRWQRRFPRATA